MSLLERYKNGKIYKIVCNKTGLVYYGSTCQKELCQRLAAHKQNYKRYLNGKYCFVTSYKILENEDFDIVLVEDYPCDNKEQLFTRERYYIDNNECVNKIRPNRTKKEYRQDNKEALKKKGIEYRKANITKMTEKFNCECGGCYTYENRAQHLKTQIHLKFLVNNYN